MRDRGNKWKLRLESEGDSMGVYFNPSNASFRQARNSRIYVDKTFIFQKSA